MTLGRATVLYDRAHADALPVIETGEDVDALIDTLLANPPHRNLAEVHSLERELMPSGWPDHELLVGVNAERGVGVLEFMDDGNYVSLGPDEGNGPVKYCLADNPTEFPGWAEIPVELVRQAVKEFLGSRGRRPTCVEWRIPEIW
ncbi:Imm1 family immunity protein [Streptacidiphilus cavernicola]|uniref:Imm1 family immunity protein n=1 Tax=Streptacidiphilus cavernicola TaxID=3342716 RepID=A0ABV6W131_9ACTN